MKFTFSLLGSTCLALAVFSMPSPASAACAFQKSLRHSGLEFNISSRPAVGCGVQVITVSVRRGGKDFANLRTDVDYLAENAWTSDLDGNGRPELIVSSRSAAEACGALDVYYLEGNVIHRSSLPSSGKLSRCRGGDQFHLEGRRIVRTIPHEISADSAGGAETENRRETYEFSNGKLALSQQQEATPILKTPADRTSVASPRSGSATTGGSGPALSEITADGSAIRITADAPIEKFRTMKLDKPERLAIDFTGASSPLAGKMVKIGNYGIKRARIGLNRGFIRVVLDSDRPVFPKYSITTSGNVIKIVFDAE